jgi:toxin CcdB
MQFDLYANPIIALRRAYPFVVVMQADIAGHDRDIIVAPLTPEASLKVTTHHLTPVVTLDAIDYAVVVPAMTSMPVRDLNKPAASLAGSRAELLAAIDYLFFGV